MGTVERAFYAPSTLDADYPTVIAADNSPQGNTHKGAKQGHQSSCDGVGQVRQDLTFFVRVARTQRLIASLQPVSDAEILQHARDLTQLMEQAWNVYLDSRDEFALHKARTYMTQRDAARRLISADRLDQFDLVTFGDMADRDMAARPSKND